MPLVLVLMAMILHEGAARAGSSSAPDAPSTADRRSGGQGSGPSAAMEPARIFVSVAQAQALIAQGSTVLDARARGFWLGHLPAAQPVDWRDFVDGWGRTGRLHPDAAAMAARLAALGVDATRPVLVYGDAQTGYGEEGRIAWLLSYLGHAQVHILDGGIAAWRRAGQALVRGPAGRPAREGTLSPLAQAGLRSEKAQVLAAQQGQAGQPKSLIVDVRSLDEWLGATPYLEARGGHIPGAVHLPWLGLLDGQGRLRDAATLLRDLAALGLQEPQKEDRPIVVYCTGGVRSAFVWAILRDLGYRQVRNYDGSFWEWAADRSLPVEKPAAPARR